MLDAWKKKKPDFAGLNYLVNKKIKQNSNLQWKVFKHNNIVVDYIFNCD